MDGESLSADEIERRLVEALARHPDATVFLLEPGVFTDPDPDHPGLVGLPITGTVLGPIGALDRIHAVSRPVALTATERARRQGITDDSTILADGRPARSLVFDTLASRGGYIGMQVPLPGGTEATLIDADDLVPVRVIHLRTDDMGRVLSLDGDAERMLGVGVEDVAGTLSIEAVHPGDLEPMLLTWAAMLNTPGVAHRVRFRRGDGHGWRWFEASIENQLEGDGAVHLELVDITSEMTAQDEVRRRERLLHRLAEALPQAIVQLEADGTVVFANGLAQSMFGGKLHSIEPVVTCAVDDDRELLGEAVDAALAGEDRDLEVRLLVPHRAEAATAQLIVAEIALRGIADEGGPTDGALCCISDVTERARLRQHLEMRATFDPLTGLHNRDSVLQALAMALAESTGRGDGVAVVFVDLDDFKAVNDQHGHAAGDDVLVAVADRLGLAVRSADIAGRIGGDEFVVVCPDVASTDDALSTAERIAYALDPRGNDADPRLLTRASVGVAWTSGGETADDLLARADAAMYRSKSEGDGRAVLA